MKHKGVRGTFRDFEKGEALYRPTLGFKNFRKFWVSDRLNRLKQRYKL